MSRTRLEFKNLLAATAPSAKVVGVGPGNIDMTYPAIRYEKNNEDVKRADNIPYDITDRYLVTCIEQDPNTPVAIAIRQLQYVTFNRSYVADSLIHTVYYIFF